MYGVHYVYFLPLPSVLVEHPFYVVANNHVAPAVDVTRHSHEHLHREMYTCAHVHSTICSHVL